MGSVPFALYLNGQDVNSAAERRAIGRPKLTPALGPLTPSSFVGGAAFTTILGGGLESAKTSKLSHHKSGTAAPKNRGGDIDSSGNVASSSRARKELNRPCSAPPRGASQGFGPPLDWKPRQRKAATPKRPSPGALPALSPTTVRLEGTDKAFVTHLLNRSPQGRGTMGARTPMRQRKPSGTVSAATLNFAAESMRGTAEMSPESLGHR